MLICLECCAWEWIWWATWVRPGVVHFVWALAVPHVVTMNPLIRGSWYVVTHGPWLWRVSVFYLLPIFRAWVNSRDREQVNVWCHQKEPSKQRRGYSPLDGWSRVIKVGHSGHYWIPRCHRFWPNSRRASLDQASNFKLRRVGTNTTYYYLNA